MNKYKSIKTASIDGVVRDSKAEARYVNDLLILQKSGRITGLKFQVPYELIPAQYDGKKCIEQAVKYIADAVYTDETGKRVVADRKGVKTPAYVIKRKLMLKVHGIRILEVG